MKYRGLWNVLFGCTALLAQVVLARAGDDPARDELSRRDYGIVRTDRSPHANLRSVDLKDVRWTGGFWADRFQQAREVTLPRLWDLAEPWAWHNMQVAADSSRVKSKVVSGKTLGSTNALNPPHTFTRRRAIRSCSIRWIGSLP